MSGPLHLLRGIPPNINGKPIDFAAFRRLVRQWGNQPGTLFASWTRTGPKTRRDELGDGSSVYFVLKGETRFRMPYVGLERVGDFKTDAEPYYLNHTAIVCYLEAKDAPPDLPAGSIAGDPPPEMARELKEMGLA